MLGKVVGTISAWTDMEDGDLLFHHFRRNSLGKHAFPDFVDGRDMLLAFPAGGVYEFKPNTYDTVYMDEDKAVQRGVDWSVFCDA